MICTMISCLHVDYSSCAMGHNMCSVAGIIVQRDMTINVTCVYTITPGHICLVLLRELVI